MTAPELDRFETALATESAERLEVAKVLATFPKPDEHAACQQRVMAGPGMQKLLDEYMAAMEKANGDNQKVMEASRRMDEGMKTIVARECDELPTAEREEELRGRGRQPAQASGIRGAPSWGSSGAEIAGRTGAGVGRRGLGRREDRSGRGVIGV